MIDKKTPLSITEWQWFRIRLQLNSLLYQGRMYRALFDFESANNPETPRDLFGGRHPEILCSIWSQATEEMIRRRSRRVDQQSTFLGWVEIEKEGIRNVLMELPVLGKTFDMESDVAFVILLEGGMGSAPLVTFVGDQVTWFLPEDFGGAKRRRPSKRR